MTSPKDKIPAAPAAAPVTAAAGKVTLEELAAIVDSLASQVATMAAGLTSLGQQVQGAVQGFTPVAQRVTELSAAFQDANTRLKAAEDALVILGEDAGQAPAEDRLSALEGTVGRLDARLTQVETVGVRRTRLQQRLASIETKLDQLLPQDEATNPEAV